MYLTIYVNFIVVLIAALTGILNYHYIKSELNILFIYISISAITQFLVSLYIIIVNKNNTPGLHFYLLVEYILYSLFYLKILKGTFHKKWIYLISILFVGYSLSNTFFIQGIWKYPNIVRAIEAIILVFYSLLFFYKTMVETRIKILWKEPLIIVNLAVLIYFSGNFIYHLFFNLFLTFSRETAIKMGYVFVFLNLIYYLLISVGFILERKKYKNTFTR